MLNKVMMEVGQMIGGGEPTDADLGRIVEKILEVVSSEGVLSDEDYAEVK